MHNCLKIILFMLVLLVLAGCNRTTSKPLNNIVKSPAEEEQRGLQVLTHFADTLQVNNVKFLNHLDKDYKDKKGCNLKKYRADVKLQLAVILSVLKFYNYNLKQGWLHEKAENKAQLSALTSQIIFEYAYLYYGRDIYYTETLNIDDVMNLIERNPGYLKNELIKKQYLDALKSRSKG